MAVVAIMDVTGALTQAVFASAVSLACHVDRMIVLVRNSHDVGQHAGMDFVVSRPALGAAARFDLTVARDDVCIFLDDFLAYPSDFVATMTGKLARHAGKRAVVGVQGTIYSDFFDGSAGARVVHGYFSKLAHDTQVNQLGASALACHGWQLPKVKDLDAIPQCASAWFAGHAARQSFPMICIEHAANWLRPGPAGRPTAGASEPAWSPELLRDVTRIAGFRFLDPAPVAAGLTEARQGARSKASSTRAGSTPGADAA